MKTAQEYVEDLAKLTDTGSDYAVAKMLRISTSRMSNYRSGRNLFDNEMCVKIAELLHIDPLEVIAAMESLRQQKQHNTVMQKFWEGIFKKSSAAMVALAILATATPTDDLRAQGLSPNNNGPYYTLCAVVLLQQYNHVLF